VPPAQRPRFYLVIGEYRRRMINERRPISKRPGRINPRGSGALYSPRESYTKLALSSPALSPQMQLINMGPSPFPVGPVSAQSSSKQTDDSARRGRGELRRGF
jgi:hypothetical protein